MKYLMRFNESKSDTEYSTLVVNEIMSHPGWEISKPEGEDWTIQLTYNIIDDINIEVVRFKERVGREYNPFYYYLNKNGSWQFMGSYSDHFSALFSKDHPSYSHLSDYDRMMKVCEYNLVYYTKKPDEDLMEDIRDCFVDISDELSEDSVVLWGFCSDTESGFFPATKFSDELSLCIGYENDGPINYELTDKIKEIFEESKERLEMFDIDPSRARIREYDGVITIIIKF
jgi:hypothetical protein